MLSNFNIMGRATPKRSSSFRTEDDSNHYPLPEPRNLHNTPSSIKTQSWGPKKIEQQQKEGVFHRRSRSQSISNNERPLPPVPDQESGGHNNNSNTSIDCILEEPEFSSSSLSTSAPAQGDMYILPQSRFNTQPLATKRSRASLQAPTLTTSVSFDNSGFAGPQHRSASPARPVHRLHPNASFTREKSQLLQSLLKENSNQAPTPTTGPSDALELPKRAAPPQPLNFGLPERSNTTLELASPIQVQAPERANTFELPKARRNSSQPTPTLHKMFSARENRPIPPKKFDLTRKAPPHTRSVSQEASSSTVPMTPMTPATPGGVAATPMTATSVPPLPSSTSELFHQRSSSEGTGSESASEPPVTPGLLSKSSRRSLKPQRRSQLNLKKAKWNSLPTIGGMLSSFKKVEADEMLTPDVMKQKMKELHEQREAENVEQQKSAAVLESERSEPIEEEIEEEFEQLKFWDKPLPISIDTSAAVAEAESPPRATKKAEEVSNKLSDSQATSTTPTTLDESAATPVQDKTPTKEAALPFRPQNAPLPSIPELPASPPPAAKEPSKVVSRKPVPSTASLASLVSELCLPIQQPSQQSTPQKPAAQPTPSAEEEKKEDSKVAKTSYESPFKPRETDDFLFLHSNPCTVNVPTFRHGAIRLARAENEMKLTLPEETLDWTAFQMAIIGGAGEWDESCDDDEFNHNLAEGFVKWFADIGITNLGDLEAAPLRAPSPLPSRSSDSTASYSPVSPAASVENFPIQAPRTSSMPHRNANNLPYSMPIQNYSHHYNTSYTHDYSHYSHYPHPEQHIDEGYADDTTGNNAPIPLEFEFNHHGSHGAWGYDGYDASHTFYSPALSMKRWSSAAGTPQMPLKSHQRTPSLDSLPQSPMMTLIAPAVTTATAADLVPMGYNLGHDLGDFLKWESEHVYAGAFYGA